MGASLAPPAVPRSAESVGPAAWLTLLSGALQRVLGIGRLGRTLRLVDSPVPAGFTPAAAVLTARSQLRGCWVSTGAL